MDDLSHKLGEVVGEMKGVRSDIKAMREKVDEMDARLRKQETRNAAVAAVAGAISGFGAILVKGLAGGGPQT